MLTKSCPYCKSIYLRYKYKNSKNSFVCLNCLKSFKNKEIIYLDIKENELFTILNESSKEVDKKRIFDFLKANNSKFLCQKNLDKSITDFLNNCYIKIEIKKSLTYKNIFDFLNNTKYNDCHCHNLECNRDTKFYGFSKRHPRGYSICCDDKKCLYLLRSTKQKGENNTCHKMTKESLESMKIKNSIIMKEKIKNKEFIPNAINSWRNEKYSLILNGKKINFRSSWEAFYNLVNKDLIYENTVIPYEYKKVKHNYIVDFSDHINKILYEIKPKSDINRQRTKNKTKSAKKWCKENNYKFIIINEDWFYENYKKHKHLLENIDMINKERLQKNLRRFDENKIY